MHIIKLTLPVQVEIETEIFDVSGEGLSLVCFIVSDSERTYNFVFHKLILFY